ncbi:hypothetical protein A3K73_01750 [Candidatus Pacearchaeota archaeon RBG_13_36_9]|nr:MAG: hypothetical protein A3K73_01750 [Candidatus Pacearchaeota archaeon RBG_13_36_9]
MKWKLPPKIKIYEALGCVGDKRIDVSGNEAKVFSSSKGKFYSVEYNESTNAIMCNDNGSYWQGYLGYPSIAFLMLKGRIKFNQESAEAFKDVKWKDLNTKFKRDYWKTEEFALEKAREKGMDISKLLEDINSIFEQIKKLNMDLLGEKIKPPQGY